MKLWRLQKSGILGKLEIKISQEWRRKHPESAEKRKEWEKNWGDLRRAQKIADFIYSRLDKSAIQRVICRRFFQKKSVDDLEEMRPWLNTNYGILWDKGKRKDKSFKDIFKSIYQPSCLDTGSSHSSKFCSES